MVDPFCGLQQGYAEVQGPMPAFEQEGGGDEVAGRVHAIAPQMPVLCERGHLIGAQRLRLEDMAKKRKLFK